MNKLLVFLILFTSFISNAESQNSNYFLECDASLKVEGDIASTGICQFGEYEIEFFKNSNSSILTALANDYSYNTIFSRQCEALVEKGDVVIGISSIVSIRICSKYNS